MNVVCAHCDFTNKQTGRVNNANLIFSSRRRAVNEAGWSVRMLFHTTALTLQSCK